MCAHPGRSHLCVAHSPPQDPPEFKHFRASGFRSKVQVARSWGVKPLSSRGPAPSREGLGGPTLVKKGAGSKS